MLPTDYNPNDPYGVRLDTLIDARIAMQDGQHQLQEMSVTLDSLADSVELWDDQCYRQLRAAQGYIDKLNLRTKINISHVEDEIETIRASEMEQ